MKHFEHVAKEFAEVLLRSVYRMALGAVDDISVVTACEDVKRAGYAVISGYWPRERCDTAIGEIDREIAQTRGPWHRWTDKLGSDHRLYFAERAGGVLRQFYNDPTIERMRRHYTGVKRSENLLLAARLDYALGNLGSGGGWHRDSPHRSQFKAILYLVDVNEGRGPFEYLSGTHKAAHSLRLLRGGLCGPSQRRFSDTEVSAIVASGVAKQQICAPAGTLIVVDSKGIHRGRPIDSGTRYALTQYCFDGKRPDHFLR